MNSASPLCLLFISEGQVRGKIKSILQTIGYQVMEIDHPVRVRRIQEEQSPAMLFLQMNGQSEEAVALLGGDQLNESVEVILLGGDPGHPFVEEAMRLGASYHFTEPYNYHFIHEVIAEIFEECGAENRGSDEEVVNTKLDQFGLMYGSSKPMRRLYRKIRKVAHVDTSVMLIGESGVGKELAAQTIHQLSPRRDMPFVGVNCGAVSRDIMESELFGHEKGSFTGAHREHSGIFEQAKGGTLYLDEVTEMEIDLQVKLLRVLETGAFRRVGGEEEFETDVRIVAATNRNPEKAKDDGKLREDLFFRLAQFPIPIPPLRERGGDVHELAAFFLGRLNQEHKTHKVFDNTVAALIKEYGWPGNVRELRNAVEHAFLMGHAEISANDFPPHIGSDESQYALEDGIVIPYGLSWEEVEKRYFLACLERNEGDKTKTASDLEISLKTLYNRLKKYAGSEEEEEDEA